ncbi:MotA/TolQ/ExbB proton channel family protein [Anaerotignum faecicola]|nr:MotA/TolQ/ExbB proton channel family protein [Anaerotignum faecicola]
MDLTTIIGIILGGILITFGIVFDMEAGVDFAKMINFLDVPSVLIVVGGTLAAVVASYPASMLKQIPKHMKIILDDKKFKPMEYIDLLVEFSQIARKNGLLALEEKANQQTDPFLKQSIMLIVDATDPEKVKSILANDLDYLADRHAEGVGMYEKASAYAPAFGMIGTLIGLVNMLKGMSLDSGTGTSSLGADMSVALITTFYGCVMANLIFMPIAKKLSVRNDEEYLCKQIIIEGVLSIQSGENPKFMKEKLISYLEQRQRDAANGEGTPGKVKKGRKDKE